jgi:hypothetical protein
MKFVVTLTNMGNVFFLRGTVWVFYKDRASVYATEAQAQEALNKAKPFMVAKTRKLARIEPTE